MPRKKGYVREDLVNSAMNIFQRRGFKGASTEVLVQELGINRNSVYLEFGSKEGLFSAVLESYDRLVVTEIFGPLESKTANLDDVEALFRGFIKSADAARGLGCLLCNTSVELGGSEMSLHARIEQYFDRLINAFCNALKGAIRIGQVATDTDIGSEANFLVSTCLGIFVMVRAGVSASIAQQAAEGALRHMQLLRTALQSGHCPP